MSVIPQFAKGTSTKIQAAIDAGIITYPAYIYETDTKKLAFIDADLSINEIVGDNDLLIEEGTENGTIRVNGEDVPVKGLGTAAFLNVEDLEILASQLTWGDF